MKKLEFKTTINATAEKVWKTMLELDTYRQWVGVSWPNSGYVGKWEKGETIRFVGDNDTGGTVAEIVELRKYEHVKAIHVALALPNNGEDRTSEDAKEWKGTVEEYIFTESNGKTELTVIIETKPDWAKMFEEGWPAALEKLKELSEHE